MSSSIANSQALPRLPIFEAIRAHDPESVAVVHSLSGRAFTYGGILADVVRTRQLFEEARAGSPFDGERIAFIVENSYDYVVTLLACLAAKAIAVPLSPAFPTAELQYILNQSEACLLVYSAKFNAKAQQLLQTELQSNPSHIELEKHMQSTGQDGVVPVQLKDDGPGGAGLMLYTSGTTNRPKGVLLPQSVLTAQSQSLLKAWEYTSNDHLLHVLPLHHIHGTVNGLLTPLFAGSTIEFLFPFNADAVWNRLAAPFLPSTGTSSLQLSKKPITFFTVVPTVYSRLLSSHKSLPADVQVAARTAISPPNMRLNISGSAALPTPIKSAWSALSHGNVLLERYGMTEVGMALSCGLAFSSRVDASVGWPLPSVQARLVDPDSGQVIHQGEEMDPATGRERSGEIQLRGPTIFQEYWRNPEATASEFVEPEDGRGGKWFKTGDIAVRRHVPSALPSTPPASPAPSPLANNSSNGHDCATDLEKSSARTGEPPSHWAQGPMYFILGRQSADIIKTGGEKVSALEVERELLSLPQISEAAVVAVPSGKWGQKVGAVLILNKAYFDDKASAAASSSDEEGALKGSKRARSPKRTHRWSAMDMRRALKGRLANYKIPQVMKLVDDIPRNAMGKINKKELVKAIFADEFSEDEL